MLVGWRLLNTELAGAGEKWLLLIGLIVELNSFADTALEDW